MLNRWPTKDAFIRDAVIHAMLYRDDPGGDPTQSISMLEVIAETDSFSAGVGAVVDQLEQYGIALDAGEQVHGRHTEGIGYPEELVDADVADAVLYFREVPLVDVRHEGKLLLRDALGLAHLHDVLAQLPSFVEIIHMVKAI